MSSNALTLTEEQKALREKWCQALESGEFRQGNGYLCRVVNGLPPHYCCLGVLCETLKLPFTLHDYPNSQPKSQAKEFDGSLTTITSEVSEKVGLSYTQVENLVHMNDGRGLTFHKIAGHIRKDDI